VSNPYKIHTFLTASKEALFQEGLSVNGNANLGNSNSDIVSIAGQLTASAGANISNGLTVTNSLTSSGGANIGGVATFTQTGDNAFNFAGSGSVQGKLTVFGGLNVQGDVTYLETTNLNVLDQKITIAKAATDFSGNPGLFVGSDDGTAAQLAKIQILSSDSAWHISSSGGLAVNATSSANFDNIGAGLVSGNEFNIERVFRAIDNTLSTATTISTVRTEYDKLRFLKTGSITNAAAETISLNKAAFVNANKNFITLDVMIRDSVNSSWTNDLVSVYMQTGSTYVDVVIDAPGVGASGWEYKLIAINENTGTLGV